jgi:Zn-dependent protease with chaperone function
MDADVLVHEAAHHLGEHATHPIELRCGTLAVLLLLAGSIPRSGRALQSPPTLASAGRFTGRQQAA